jgi:hypothetical protein
LDEPVSPIQVNSDIVVSQDHLDLVIAGSASVLGFDHPMMEFPQCFIAFREFLPECRYNSRMLRKAQLPSDQESLRNIEHRIVRTGYSEVEIPVVSEASAAAKLRRALVSSPADSHSQGYALGADVLKQRAVGRLGLIRRNVDAGNDDVVTETKIAAEPADAASLSERINGPMQHDHYIDVGIRMCIAPGLGSEEEQAS